MRSLNRDRRSVWVSLYSSKEKVYEGTGSERQWTGEWRVVRSTPVLMHPTLSAAKGAASMMAFGMEAGYTRTAIFDQTGTGITETSVMWVSSAPQFDSSGNLVVDSDGNPSVPFDYVVTGVAESPNVTQVALKKVDRS